MVNMESYLVAIISDIHSNLEALEVVDLDIKEVRPDIIVCTGDTVGYGANPNECVEWIYDKVSRDTNGEPLYSTGNHDRALILPYDRDTEYWWEAAVEALKWNKNAITPENLEKLKKLCLSNIPSLGEDTPTAPNAPPRTKERELRPNSFRYSRKQNDFMINHGSLLNPADFGYVSLEGDDELYDPVETNFGIMEEKGSNLLLMGHSHVPVIFKKTADDIKEWDQHTIREGVGYNKWFPLGEFEKTVINVGSVGFPRYNKTFPDPRAKYVLLKFTNEGVFAQYRALKFDLRKTLEKLNQPGLSNPDAENPGTLEKLSRFL